MLRRSFIFLPGVGASTERSIWEQGIIDWDDFILNEVAGPLRGERKARSDIIVREVDERLRNGDIGYFASFFKTGENWRLWDEFGDGAVFLDIETMGTRRYSPITVVGVYDGMEFRALIRGKDLNAKEISRLFEDASMLVTFNGATFDLPMIEAQFPGSVPRLPHLDLRFLAGRLGYVGGLKSIEHQRGISRPEEVQGMSGEDAIRLWKLFERDRNRNALKLLLKYNMEDIMNLSPMTESLVGSMKRKVIG